jgi:hypothetical protein
MTPLVRQFVGVRRQFVNEQAGVCSLVRQFVYRDELTNTNYTRRPAPTKPTSSSTPGARK